MGGEASNKQDTIPNPRQGLRFVKNEQGEWKQEIVAITEETLQPQEKGIILVGHISRLKDQIITILNTGFIKANSVTIIEKGSLPEDSIKGFDPILEKLKQEQQDPKLIFEIRKEIADIFDFPKIKTPDFHQRKAFHQKYNPKIYTKKGPSMKRTKQRRK